MSGPKDRHGRWHYFLAQFQLDIIYEKGEDLAVPDVMSRRAYPAAHAAPDVSIMRSQADVEGWEADDRKERNWADSQVAATFLQSTSRHIVPGTDSLPVCVRLENRCICRRSSKISLHFAGLMRKNSLAGRFIRVTCGICNTGFLFPRAHTAVRKGSSGPCAKIMMSRTGHIRVWSLCMLVYQIHFGHPQSP